MQNHITRRALVGGLATALVMTLSDAQATGGGGAGGGGTGGGTGGGKGNTGGDPGSGPGPNNTSSSPEPGVDVKDTGPRAPGGEAEVARRNAKPISTAPEPGLFSVQHNIER